ncbi:MAG: aryl-sulfate sulfotransferase, partial [Promethearchaeota archaeon]
GNIVYQLPSPSTSYGFGHPINSTTLLLFSTGGNTIFWNIYTNESDSFPVSGHHDITYNPRTETFVTLYREKVFSDGHTYLIDTIVELDKLGNIIWSLNMSFFIPISWWNGQYTSGLRDITHGNSVFWDIEDDMIYFNARNIDTFFKINHRTGELVWGLGKYGNFTLYDLEGNQRSSIFYHAHALEKVADHTFIIFDNDWYNPANTQRSRILEITINETTMTANESWVWKGPQEYYSGHWSDADRLPNGNRFGCFGTQTHLNTNIGPRLVEVNESGHIVWEMNWVGSLYGIYQADRFRLRPIVSSPSDVFGSPTDNINVTWQTWYNFRNRLRINGSYSLFLNDVLLETNIHTFDQFWRATNLTIDLGTLEAGKYNLTLILADEEGHTITDSVSIKIANYFVERHGPLSVEQGQENSILSWQGSSINPLTFNLTLNTTSLASGVWEDSFIYIDLNTLEVGTYLVAFELLNGSEVVYNETLWVNVYPNAPPIILTYPADQQIAWNESLILSWRFFDTSPIFWSVFVNDSLKTTDTSEIPNYQFNWSVPVLNEGNYNITLVLSDLFGHETVQSLWLTIFPPQSPVIFQTHQDNVYQWGQENVTLSWEVHGAINWKIWRNNSLLEQGEVINNLIEVKIENWHEENWRPGAYNLTLQVTNEEGITTSYTSWVYIKVVLGDSYANSVVLEQSMWFQNAENAISSPDGKYSTIYVDYGNGYLTLDMGKDEEIIDGDGNDFTVIADGGEYLVKVSDSLEQQFLLLEMGIGNKSFDLSSIGVFSVRYVQIEYFLGDNVLLDAISAINFNTPVRDDNPPSIIGPEDFWIFENQTETMLTWEVYDATPWNYSILINGELINWSSWNGSDITFIASWTNSGNVNVTLVVYDAFSNHANDTVTIEIRPLTSTPSNSTPTSANEGLFPLLIIIIISVPVLIIITRSLRKNWK